MSEEVDTQRAVVHVAGSCVERASDALCESGSRGQALPVLIDGTRDDRHGDRRDDRCHLWHISLARLLVLMHKRDAITRARRRCDRWARSSQREEEAIDIWSTNVEVPSKVARMGVLACTRA